MRKKYRDKENVSRLISLRSSLAVKLLDLSTTCLHLAVWCLVLLLDIKCKSQVSQTMHPDSVENEKRLLP